MKLDFALDPDLDKLNVSRDVSRPTVINNVQVTRRVALLDEIALDVVRSNRPRQCWNTYRGLTPKSCEETRLP